jgi:KDO2-lipid IV(A) lauroyltransferase
MVRNDMPQSDKKPSTGAKGTLTQWLTDRILRGLIASALLLPYKVRVPLFGKLTRGVIAPVAGYTRRSRANLAMIWPKIAPAKRRAIAGKVSENFGRVVIENYAPAEFAARAQDFEISGPGWHALQDAVANKRLVLVVSAHFGNYEAIRASMRARGISFGAMYRPMTNGYFNPHYVEKLEAVAGPMFTQGRRGVAGFLRQLSSGTPMILLNDLYIKHGVLLPFLGKPARTALSAAEMALRYNALLLPAYGIRRDGDRFSYRVVVEAPITPSDAETMTRALNASLEAQIEQNPEQWFWIHRRWKT